MFPRGSGMFRDRRRKETGGKKKHGWFHPGKKKKENRDANLFATVIMSSGDSSPPVQASSMISSTGFDVTDEARLAKVSPTTTPSSITPEKISKPVENEIPDADVEAIEEAMPIVQKTSPVPESPPKIERNGFNMDTRKTLDEREENMCLIDCIYYTQQCCNCTIL